ATGGNVVADPSLSSVGSVTYYAEAYSFNTGCTSTTRTAVTLELIETPIAPVNNGDLVACYAEGVVLNAQDAVTNTSGFDILWYDTPVGGNLVTDPTLTLVGNITYYAENINIETGCASNERTAVVLTLFDCSINLIKEAELVDNNGCSDPGDTVLFTYTVGNSGNIELTNINIEDPLLQDPNPQVSIAYLSGDDNNDGILGLNELWIYTAEYSITQDDLDSGVISSTASVQAETYFNETTSDLSHDVSFFEDGPTSISICQEGRIGIIMEGTWNDLDGDFTADVGETITYTFSIKNFSGSVVTDINVASQNPEVEISVPANFELEEGEEDFTSITATYTLKQEDIDRLFFDAQVIATASLSGVELTDNSDPVSYDDDAPTRVILPRVGSQVDEIAVYNGVTPNGDGKNDFFWIENIDAYSGNEMKIYNRWGVLVWESRGYNETNNVFRGYANVGSASGSGNLLPTGTYFYVLSFDANSQPINGQSAYTGYLYLNQ
ncbi:MAG: gliding motility-associated C-terminal domain-containing protein, partial [Bacteroidetes bacterium]|nr:gliding motility-associated C-terminal domain-containing protein [Bacteroidota bacterium]